MFTVTNFSTFCDKKQILDSITLSFLPGSYHVLLGKNGSGKSTLALALAGHPRYQTSGTAILGNQELSILSAHERSRAGLFVLFQHPYEIPALPVSTFLYEIARAHNVYTGSAEQFGAFLKPLLTCVRFDESILSRPVHHGFSGGEKKRLELLQMLLLKPRVAILDEPDSGLDVNAVSLVHECITALRTMRPETIILLITHYPQLFSHTPIDAVHIIENGKIVRSGNESLGKEIFAKGFS